VEEYFEEWKLLSRLVPPNNVNVSDLHTLSQRDFDICFDWGKTTISNDVVEDLKNHILKIVRRLHIYSPAGILNFRMLHSA
jgi:hypothetical protein